MEDFSFGNTQAYPADYFGLDSFPNEFVPNYYNSTFILKSGTNEIMIIDVRRLDAVKSWIVVPSNKIGSVEIDNLIAVNFGKSIVAVYEDLTIYGIDPIDASTYSMKV